MNLKPLNILLIASFLFILIIYPYTKEIKLFKANDINWDIINQSKSFKEFDRISFSFQQTYEFSDDILNLDNSVISVKGFIKKHKHFDHNDFLLTETVTDVCFMCNHDEQYNMIRLNTFSDSSEFKSLKDDTYITVNGIFKINRTNKNHPVFGMDEVVITEIIN